MKKLPAVLAVCLLAVMLALPAVAAGTGSSRIDVTARFELRVPWSCAVSDGSGNAEVTLPDGTVISAQGIPGGGWFLVAERMTEADAVGYVNDTAGHLLDNRLPLHVFLMDGAGNIRRADGISLTVSGGESFSRPKAYALQGKQATELAVSGQNTVTFVTDGSTVYVVGNASDADPDLPVTGDAGGIPWAALLLLSGGASAVLCMQKRKIRSAKEQ